MDALARAGLADIGSRGQGGTNRFSDWLSTHRMSLRHRSRFIEGPASVPFVAENLINRALPPELLLFIFSMLTYDIADQGATWHYSPLWIYVTHVCRSWRDLAMASSLLWSRISFAHPDLASAMLARSGDALLDLAYGDRLARLPPLALYAALAQLPRTSRLRLNVTKALLAHLAARLPDASHTLQRIHIDLVDGLRGPAMSRALPGFANLRAPQLRVLILDGVPIKPNAPLLACAPHLAELALSGLPRHGRWRVADLLRVLDRTPRLTRLLLVQALEDDAEDSAGAPISLPLLSQLTLHAPTPAVASLISRDTGGPQTRFALSCTARAHEDAYLSRAVPPALRSGALKRLDIEFQLTEFVVRGYTECDGPSVLELSLEPERVLDARHSSGRASLVELMESAVDFSAVERLMVMHDGAIARENMEEVYAALARRMPALADFGVHARDMDYETGTVGNVFLRRARRIRVRIRSWQPTGYSYRHTGRDWAVACIRKWSFDEGDGPEEVILDGETFAGAKLAALLESNASHKDSVELEM